MTRLETAVQMLVILVDSDAIVVCAEEWSLSGSNNTGLVIDLLNVRRMRAGAV
jgi:hypothetical protein